MFALLTVGASLLAKNVNDNACILIDRVALESIASRLAPTGAGNHYPAHANAKVACAYFCREISKVAGAWASASARARAALSATP